MDDDQGEHDHDHGVIAAVNGSQPAAIKGDIQRGEHRNTLQRAVQGHAVHPEHPLDDRQGPLDVLGTKKDKGDVDEVKGDEPGKKLRHLQLALLPDVIDHQPRAVHPPPDDEGPTGTVPEPRNEHRNEDRDQRTVKGDLTEGAQNRCIEVGSDEIGQGHVPALPEVDHAGRAVGAIEVDRQLDIEHPADADRHVAIAAEIEVELEGIGEAGHPGDGEMEWFGTGEPGLRPDGKGVGDHHLLEQTDQKEPQPQIDIAPVEDLVPQSIELRHHLLVMEDRTGEQMGEEGDEERVVEQVALLNQTFIGIDQERNLGDGKETDPERQDDPQQRQLATGDKIHRPDKEVHVLEPAEEEDIGCQAEDQDRASRHPHLPATVIFDENPADGVVEEDRAEDQRHIFGVPPTVKEQGGEQQPGTGRNAETLPQQQKIDDQRYRQEEKDEFIGTE